MGNKLSELSKPAWIVGQQEIDDFMRGDEALLVRGHDPESTEPALRMYSQEYVSALLADNEALKIRAGQQQSVAANNLEMFRKADERAENLLAELEAKDKRIAELELRLAVEIEPPPVIYPGRYDCHAMHSAIRRAGFRVSGDSEHVGDVDMRDERALAAVSDKQRIAELEAIRSDASQVFKEIGNELGCNPDNESIMMAIDDLKKDNTSLRDQRAGLVQAASELRAKLATPVRLPTEHELHQVSCSECAGNCLELVESTVRAAGFTVEGNEQ